MCGIFGVFSKKEFYLEKAIDFFSKIKHRGEDFVFIVYSNNTNLKNSEIISAKNFEELKQKSENIKVKSLIGMNYFSIFGRPIIFENFVFNGEVFNYEELKEKFQIKNLKNDGELIKKSFELDKLDLLKAIYAFAYFDKEKNTIYLLRDIIGVNPLFYRLEDSLFIFGSENKIVKGTPLNPRFLIKFNIKNFSLVLKKRKDLFKKPDSLKKYKLKSIKEIKKLIEKYLIENIILQAKQAKKVGVLFSGGVDSTFIAKILQENKIKFKCCIVGHEKSEDVVIAEKVAQEFGFDYEVKYIDEETLKKDLEFLVNGLETSNIMKISVGIPIYYGSLINKYKVIFSGIGSEELFGGYERHLKNIKKECEKGLLTIWERDLYRDNVASFLGGSELRTPFLSEELIYLSKKIPNNWKIRKISKKEKEIIKKFFNKEINYCKKYLLIKIAKKHINFFAYRPKKAAQYGSKSEKIIEKIAKTKNLDKREYLKTLLKEIKPIEDEIF